MATKHVRQEGMAMNVPDSLWTRVASHPSRLMILDYDGTLAALGPERQTARPSHTMLELLRGISALPGRRPVVLSGRSLPDLRRLLTDLDVHLIGEHGWDEWSHDRGRVLHHPDIQVRLRLDEAVRDIESRGWAPMLEIKRCSVVLHTRGVARDLVLERERTAAQLWARHAAEPGLRLDHISGGLELRASARDKGTAVAALILEAPANTLVTFIGDDLTDEAGFAEIGKDGITVRVGDDDVPTAAEWRLHSPREVEDFLRSWLGAASITGRA
jgi:trehalose-phosphatase